MAETITIVSPDYQGIIILNEEDFDPSHMLRVNKHGQPISEFGTLLTDDEILRLQEKQESDRRILPFKNSSQRINGSPREVVEMVERRKAAQAVVDEKTKALEAAKEALSKAPTDKKLKDAMDEADEEVLDARVLLENIKVAK